MHLHNSNTGFTLKEGRMIYLLDAGPGGASRNPDSEKPVDQKPMNEKNPGDRKWSAENVKEFTDKMSKTGEFLGNLNVVKGAKERVNKMTDKIKSTKDGVMKTVDDFKKDPAGMGKKVLDIGKKAGAEYAKNALGTIDGAARATGNKFQTLRPATDKVNELSRAGIDALNGESAPDKNAQPEKRSNRPTVKLDYTKGPDGKPSTAATDAKNAEKEKVASTDSSEVQNEVEPGTHRERLTKDMNDAVQEFRNAENTLDKFAALMKLLGSVKEYLGRAMRGSLDELINKPKENGPKNSEANNALDSDDAAARVKKKLDDASAKPNEKGDKPANLEKNIDKVREENQKKIDANNETIKDAREGEKKLKGENVKLIDEKSSLEKQKNELQGSENSEGKIAKIDIEMKNVQEKIDSNNKAIKQLDDLADTKEKENKKLEEEQKVLDDMKKQVPDALKTITDMFKLAGLKVTIETYPNGKWKLIIEGLDNDLKNKLDPKATEGKPAEVSPDDIKDNKPEPKKAPEKKNPSANEIQEGRLNIVDGQIRSLGIERGVKIEGSARTGAALNAGSVDVRYDQGSHTWQVKQVGETTWKDPANEDLGKDNADLSQRLKIFNKELANWNKDEEDALKREQGEK